MVGNAQDCAKRLQEYVNAGAEKIVLGAGYSLGQHIVDNHINGKVRA